MNKKGLSHRPRDRKSYLKRIDLLALKRPYENPEVLLKNKDNAQIPQVSL